MQASLLGSGVASFSPLLIEQAILGLNRQPTGTRGQTSGPTDIFKTRDGHVITQVLGSGLRTPDIWSEGTTQVGTAQMGDAVVKALG